MKKELSLLRQFHRKFNHPWPDHQVPNLSPEQRRLRLQLQLEELVERADVYGFDLLHPIGNIFTETSACYEPIEMDHLLKEMEDELYVLLGSFAVSGLHKVIGKGFEEIHMSNMSKLGADGKPVIREDGKTLKGPGYFEPNMEQFIDKKK